MILKSIGVLLIGVSHFCYDAGLWCLRSGKKDKGGK